MTNETDFDELSRRTNAAGAGTTEAFNNLFAAVYALPKWHFIARGELPNINPYVAANADYADGQQMIRAFTDTEKLQRFAKENGLTDAAGAVQMLDIPTENITGYLEQFIDFGVHGIWFNSDLQSDGFFTPLKQLRPIKEHLAKIGWQTNAGIPPISNPVSPESFDAQNDETETAVISLRDGLLTPENVFRPDSRTYFCFCRLPKSWTNGERVKDLVLEKLFDIIYRDKWNAYQSTDGSRYIVPNPTSRVFGREEAVNLDWKILLNAVGDVLFLFYAADENGDLREVTESTFRQQIDSSVQKMYQNFDGYINWFRSGKINSGTSFKPFFKAIAPMLRDYAGSGEFTFTFATGMDDPQMKDLFEDVTSNAYGAYLKYRSYIFQRSANDITYDMQILGSNILTNVQTNEKMLVQLTMHNTLETGETKMIVRLLGKDSEVEKIGSAIQPALDDCGFQVQLESKREPSIDALKEIGG